LLNQNKTLRREIGGGITEPSINFFDPSTFKIMARALRHTLQKSLTKPFIRKVFAISGEFQEIESVKM